MGTQHLRCEVQLPASIRPFPTLLKEAGYFVTNYAKTDYNFSPEGIYHYWKKDYAPWRQRKDDEPFFSFFVLGDTHEGPGNTRTKYHSVVANLPQEKRHDPAKANVPPYFPDTPKMRELWARYYDLVSAMDAKVGQIIQALEEDGLLEDTIIWFFSDHGHGLPRHKRWLLDSGLRVPLIVVLPEKYQHLASATSPGSIQQELVSFVDFAPTVLNLAGLGIPNVMQGRPFLGPTSKAQRAYIYGARDRADDMFEVSRAIHDGRFVYVRHFLPHLPYVQAGRIMGNQKESMAELRRARDSGELDEVSSLIFAASKPVEEFYDLEADPFEVHNLARNPSYQSRVETMRNALFDWIIEHRDTGMLTEAEYQLRAKAQATTVYDMAQSVRYPIAELLETADRSTRLADAEDLKRWMKHTDSGVRYWAISALRNQTESLPEKSVFLLHSALEDPSPSVAITAATVLCLEGHDAGLDTLKKQLISPHPLVALEAARAMLELGERAKPAVPYIESIRKGLEGQSGKRRYRDFNYASFTGWALEHALIQCGAALPSDFE